MTVTGKHLIAGEWVSGEATFRSSPATGEARDYSVGTPAHVDRAVRRPTMPSGPSRRSRGRSGLISLIASLPRSTRGALP